MIKKTYYLYRIFENGIENYAACSHIEAESLEKLKNRLINEELFHYECFPEEWEEVEKEIGLSKKEMLGMDFMEILDRLHDKYFLVAEYNYCKQETLGGPAIPYND